MNRGLSHNTAVHVLTKKVPTVVEDHQTIGEVERLLLKNINSYRTINYVYVVDAARKLIGVFSIRDMFRQEKTRRVRDLMKCELITAQPFASQEHVAYLALHHQLKAIPIVNHRGVFRGVVPDDAILHTIYQESREDLFRAAGVHHPREFERFDNVLTLPLHTAVWHRLPWLILGMLGGIFVAKIIGQYERILAQNIMLAAFIPLIVYISDAVGTQMEAFVIRDFAIQPHLKFRHYFARQFAIIIVIAAVTSFFFFGFSMVFVRDVHVATIVSLALIPAILSSIVTGLFIPYLLGKLNIDPANASGPLATILQNILSIVIYFTIASTIL